MINHPSYKNDMGCTEYDVDQAIARSADTGEEVGLPYSDAAARRLRDACDWESDDEYDYRGQTCDSREWRVYLQGPGSPEPEPEYNGRISEMGNGFPPVGAYVGGGGSLYRVIALGRIQTGGRPGESNWCPATLEPADWEDCPEGDEFPARAEIDEVNGRTFADWLEGAGRTDTTSSYDLRAAWRRGEDPGTYTAGLGDEDES